MTNILIFKFPLNTQDFKKIILPLLKRNKIIPKFFRMILRIFISIFFSTFEFRKYALNWKLNKYPHFQIFFKYSSFQQNYPSAIKINIILKMAGTILLEFLYLFFFFFFYVFPHLSFENNLNWKWQVFSFSEILTGLSFRYWNKVKLFSNPAWNNSFQIFISIFFYST